MADGSPTITRRKALAGAAGLAGVAAIAGCVSDEAVENAQVARDTEGLEMPQPPEAIPDNDTWRYVVESMAYQNQQAEAQTKALVALLDDAGIEED